MLDKNFDNQFVVFKLGQEYYGIDILNVKTIERLTSITRVPNSPPYVKGVMNLRGEVIPVIDMQERFRLSSGEYTNETRIIIVNIEDVVIGMIVDSASEVLSIPWESIDEAPKVVDGISEDFVSGIGKLSSRLVIILNLRRVLGFSD